MKLAYSYDGLEWFALNGSKPILIPDVENSSNRLRDPFIYRDIDGDFLIIGTQGWSYPSVYFFKSKDLIKFTDQKLIILSYFEPSINLSGQRAWAPEIIYDVKSHSYLITYSDSINGIIYAVNTVDFESFSYPRVLFNPNYLVIDQTIFKNSEGYWLFYKDERPGAKTIFFAFSNSLAFENAKIFDQNFLHLQKNIEGPTVFTTIDGKYTYLYFDHYKQERLIGIELTKGEENQFIPKNELEIILPQSRMRHPSIIKITKKELDALIRHYE